MISAIIYIAASVLSVDFPWYGFILPVLLDLVILDSINKDRVIRK